MTEKKKRRWPKVLAWVFGLPAALIFLLAIVVVFVENGTVSTTTQGGVAQQESARKPNLELLEDKVEIGEYGNRYIVGAVKNNRNRKYSYVQITFALYDESGAQVGTALDNISDLEAGGTWRFKAIILEDSARQYKLAELSGW